MGLKVYLASSYSFLMVLPRVEKIFTLALCLMPKAALK